MILVDKAWLNHAKSNFQIASRDPILGSIRKITVLSKKI